MKDRFVNVCLVSGVLLLVGGLFWRSPWLGVSASGLLLTGMAVLIGLKDESS